MGNIVFIRRLEEDRFWVWQYQRISTRKWGGPFTRWGLGGELFGAIGTEFVLNGNVGYYAEAGFCYLTFAGQSFSTTQQFLSPTLSLGIRFY